MKPLSIGVDIVEVNRFTSLDYDKHKKFYERFFTPREIEYCLSFKRPATHFAANFAGKEAVYKALNRFHDVNLRDIEILRDNKGTCVNLNSFHKAKHNRRQGESLPLEVKVSLSHSSSYAIAFALISRSVRKRE